MLRFQLNVREWNHFVCDFYRIMHLNAKTLGQGPPLIILHGLFGSLDNWMTHARKLSEDFTVYLVDQRNHGKSPHSNEWSYPLMAEDLHEFMSKEGIYASNFLGHSMGGKTVIQFAMQYPEQIEKLIVADMGVKAYPPHHTEIIAALKSVDLLQVQSRNDVDRLLQAGIKEFGVRQFLLKGLGRDQEKKFAWKFNLKVLSEKYEEVLAPIEFTYPFEGPTLFIHGGNSQYVLEEDKGEITSYFPYVFFDEIPSAGHWLHAEAPDEFITKVRDFLID